MEYINNERIPRKKKKLAKKIQAKVVNQKPKDIRLRAVCKNIFIQTN